MLEESSKYQLYHTPDLIQRHILLCSSNQYLYVELENGAIKKVKRHSRYLAYFTLGLSMLFTSPYVIVKGKNDIHSREFLGRIEGSIKSTVIFVATEGEGNSTDV